MSFDVRRYRPGGPTVKRFHESTDFYRFMAGPIGSSKTTGAGVAEMPFTVMMQEPEPDGVRRAKVGVIRDTYRNLYATFIPTWFQWFPKDLGHFVGSDDRPAMHTLTFEGLPLLGKQGQVVGYGPGELQVEMRAMGANSVENVCRGWELSGAYLDEMDQLPAEAPSYLAGRVMRFGRKPYRRTRGVWGTFNKPDFDHWLYDQCEADRPEGLAFFDQPGGLLPGGPPYVTNPLAENLENLDDGYYVRAAQGQPEWYIRRMIRNQWGASVSGEPIYLEFDRDRHVSPIELEPQTGDELVLGMDGGGTPAAVIMGRNPKTGRRIIYAEVVLVDPSDPKGRRLMTGVGPKRFAEAIRDVLQTRFRGCRVSIGYGDPAAFYGADREFGEYSFMEIVERQAQIPVQPAPSNEIDMRLEAVRQPLGRLNRYDGQPDLIINPSCRWIIRGFGGDYKWEARDPKQPGKRLKPQKSVTSHVHDALQYVLLGDQGRAGVASGMAFDRHQPRRPDGGALGDPWAPQSVRDQRQAAGSVYGSDFDLWKS